MDERNYGIDLLKIIAMLYILLLHINLRGGLIGASGSLFNQLIVTILEVISLCAVNIYAIISGYLKVSNNNKRRKYLYSFKRILYLWLEVVFYALITSIIFALLGLYKIDGKAIFMIITPVSSNYVWYFTAYVGLFFLEPILTTFIEKTDNKNLLIILIILTIVFCFYPSIMLKKFGDFWFLNAGYSVWWLVILFLAGGIIKKTELEKKVKPKKVIIILIISYLISYLAYNFSGYIHLGSLSIYNLCCKYNSLTTFIICICYLLLFANLKLNDKVKSVVKYFSAATFGVYVMHLHPVIWQFIKNRFVFILKFPIIFEPFIVVLIAVVLLFIMLFIDKVREYLFKKLKIDKFCSWVNEIINYSLDQIKIS